MIFKKVLQPNRGILRCMPPMSFAALAFIFEIQNTKSTLAYLVYCMSAYSLIIWISALPKMIKSMKSDIRNSKIMQKAIASKIMGRYLTDTAFRGSINIYQGMTVNFFYVVFRVIAGIRYASVWFISMAAYYLVLGILRLYLIGMIVLMVRTNSGFSYPGYIIYLSAFYTFYTMVISVLNLVKFRKLGSPILSAAKVLNFIAAMMSILGLQTAMISRFSENGEAYRKMMNTITGGFVYGIVIVIAITMLLHSKKSQKKVESIE